METVPFGEIKEDEFFTTPIGTYQKIKEVWGTMGPNNAIRQQNKRLVCFADVTPVTPTSPIIKTLDI